MHAVPHITLGWGFIAFRDRAKHPFYATVAATILALFVIGCVWAFQGQPLAFTWLGGTYALYLIVGCIHALDRVLLHT